MLYERFSLQPCEQRLIGHSRVTVIDMLRSHLLDQKVSSYCCCYCCHFISASLILRGIPHSENVSDQPRSAQASPDQPRSAQISSDQLRSASISSAQIRSAQSSTDQLRSAHISSDQLMSAESGSDHQRSCQGIPFICLPSLTGFVDRSCSKKCFISGFPNQ